MSRKSDLDRMARLVGNAAAHFVLYPDRYGSFEAALYMHQAEAIGHGRRWNDDEIEHFRRRARYRAEQILHERAEHWRDRSFTDLMNGAADAVDTFIAKKMK